MSEFFNIDNINGGYHKYQVLKNVSFQIKEGEFLGIIGPNGSGKSTLLRTLSQYLKPSSGIVLYRDNDLYTMAQNEIARDFAFVPQDTVFNFSFTVWEIVLMGRIPYLRRMQSETRQDFEKAKEAMRITDTLKLNDRQVNELSAGERQMVIIAKALAQEPKALFLDEPTSHLDIGHQVQILNLLKELNQKQKITVIIVLHDLNLASEYCDRILLLNNGSVHKIGEPQRVLTYQTIEEVYKTLVIVNKNPITGNPHILLVRKEKT
jgi:iron complex transport system ATP-binding protein